MADHRTFDSSEVHEPKHISNSLAADAGKVITPLSGGTSELRNLTPAEVGVVFSYGEMNTDDNDATDFAITIAGDISLADPADYIELTSVRVPTVEGDIFNMVYDGTLNRLTTQVAGIYRVGGWVNASSTVNNTKIGIKYTVGGVATGGKLVTDLAASGRKENLSGFGLVELPAGAEIGVGMAADKSATISVSDMRLNLELIRST